MSGITLRYYQEEVRDMALDRWKRGQDSLFELCTAAGKTIIFSSICRELPQAFSPDFRTCIVTHLETLVTQAEDKLLKVWDGAETGVVCDKKDKVKDGTKKITLASMQSLLPYLEKNPSVWFDALIIDEAHHIPPKDEESTYASIIEILRQRNPSLRMAAFTATAFRLGQGPIYGGERAWFKQADYRLSVKEAQDKGFVSPCRVIVPVDIREELSGIPLTASGEYQQGALSALLTQPRHVDTAVQAVKAHCHGRKSIAVFAMDIDHCEKLRDAFVAAGEKAEVVHSLNKDNSVIFENFSSGKTRVLISVDMLTEGYDNPGIDAIIECAATKSLSRRMQVAGRGFRLADGKEDCLLVDLVGNTFTHGTPRNPVPQPVKGRKRPLPDIVVCPECQEVNEGGAKSCSACGLAFAGATPAGPIPKEPRPVGTPLPVQAKDLPMYPWREDEDFRARLSGDGGFPVQVLSAVARVESTRNFQKYILMNIRCLHEGHILSFPMSLDIEGCISSWNKRRFNSMWQAWGDGETPANLQDFMARQGEMLLPAEMEIRLNKYGHIYPLVPEQESTAKEETFAAVPVSLPWGGMGKLRKAVMRQESEPEATEGPRP